MRWFFKGKDGGPESNVTGYWLVEAKNGLSIVLLRFDEGSREAYHDHAFNALSWVLKGHLTEFTRVAEFHDEDFVEWDDLLPSFKPVFTPRDRMHKVYGMAKRTWVLSFRGPWLIRWHEWLPELRKYVTLTHGRKIVPHGLVNLSDIRPKGPKIAGAFA